MSSEEKPSVNNIFIVGAGFDKSVFPELPLNDELLPLLIEEFNDFQHVRGFIDKYQTTNIEQILTSIDLEIASSHNGRRQYFEDARKWIEKSIVEYFEKFQFNDEQKKPWTKSFMASVLQQNDVLVSLNYSCILDQMLDYYEVWSPYHGYSRHIENVVEILSQQGLINNETKKNIQLCKIHGSVHFRKVNDSQKKSLITFPINTKWFPENVKDSSREVGIPEDETTIYIIAPSFIKTHHVQLLCMMEEILHNVGTAKNLIIMGCGMRPEDSFLWLLVSAFLNSACNGKRLIIVDPKAQAIMQRLEEFFFPEIEHFFKDTSKAISIQGRIDEKMDELEKFVKLDN